MVGLVVLRLQTNRVRLDPEVDVLGDEDRRRPRIGLLDVVGQGDEAIIYGGASDGQRYIAVLPLQENAQAPTRWQRHPFAQAALAP